MLRMGEEKAPPKPERNLVGDLGGDVVVGGVGDANNGCEFG